MSLYRAAIAMTAADLIAVISGAFVTSSKVALQPGQPEPNPAVHIYIALAVLILALGFAIWARRLTAWLAFAALALAGAIAAKSTMAPSALVWHALFAHVSIALITATAVLAAPSWSEPAKPIDAASKALRPAALATPPAVLIQIALGALYRHQITGIMPHMLGAMLVALLALLVSVTLLQQFPDHPQLKRPAALLISVILLQVCLGVAVFILLLLGAGNTAAFAWTATAHVTVGTLAFAASTILALQAARHLA